MLADNVLENVPNHRLLLLDHFLGLLDRSAVPLRLELVIDERFEELESHFLRQAALIQLELGTDHDDRAAGVVDALAEQVLTETPLLALEGVAQGLQRAVVGAAQDAAAAPVIEERVHGFLQHALFVADDDVRRVKLHELLQAVVAVDDAAVEVVQIGRGEAAAIERHKRAQLGRKHWDDVENHPFGFIAAFAESLKHLQALGVLDALLERGIALHLLAELIGKLVHLDPAEELLDGFRPHLGHELPGVFLHELTVFLFLKDLALAENRDVVRINDDKRLEIEDALEIPHGNIEQVADTAGQALEEPDVRTGRGQLDVAKALAAHLAQRDFHAAFIADDAAVLHPLVFAAEAFPVGDRTKDFGAEQAVAFRLEGPVVNGFRLGDFAVRPRTNFFRTRQADPDGIKIRDQAGAIIGAAAIQGCFLPPRLSPETRADARSARLRTFFLPVLPFRRALPGLKPGTAIQKSCRAGAQGSRPIGASIRRLFRLRLLPLHQLDVEAERLQLADEHVERLGHARLDARLALDDGLVNLGAAIDIIGFGREQFLQDVRCAVGFERPDFHFAEALPTELRFAAEGLLGDERVRSDGASVNLVVHQVRELEHVDVPDRDGLIELVAGHAVEEIDLAGMRQTRHLKQVANLGFAGAIENRRGEWNALTEALGVLEQLIVAELAEGLPDRGLGEDFAEPAAERFGARFLAENAAETIAELFGGPAEVCLENLADIHARRHAEGIEHDLDRGAIGHVGHVFLRNNARDHALVSVAAGHFVADGKLALHGDIDLNQLDDPRRKFVALLQLFLALLCDLAQDVDLARGHLLDLFDLFDQERILFVELEALEVARRDFLDELAGQFGALVEEAFVGLLVVQVGLQNLAAEQVRKALQALIRENADFVGKVFFELEDLVGFNGFVPLVFFSALAGEDFHVNDGAFDARRAVKGGIANVAGFFAENGTKQFFFRRERGFALGRNLADQNVAGLHDRADTDDAAFVQVAEERLANIGNVARDLFGAQLGVARLDFILLDMNRGVVIVFDELFADENGVLEVVAAPRQEGDQDVAAKPELAAVGARTIGKHLAFFHAVAHANKGLLVNASVLIRTLEFDERVDIGADFAAQHAGVVGLDAHDDAFGVHLVNDAIALAKDDGAGIARGDALHAGADERSFSPDERHGLALHVGTHERAIRVVVLEERNQAGGHGDELFRGDVNVVHFVAAFQDEVAGLPAVDEFRSNAQLVVERDVGLRHDVLVLFPSREIETIGLVDNLAALQLFVKLLDFVLFHDIAGFEFAVAGVHDLHIVDDAAALHLAIRRLDEAVVVDAGEAAQGADEADVRTFRRFDGADAAVVRRVNVADLESRAFARKAAGTEGGETPLMRDLAERIGLIHELAELRGAEKFADRRHDRLGVHQIVRHSRGHFLVDAHLFLDGPLHADQADAELVLEQFADRADAAVAEVVDVVDDADVLAQLEQILDGRDEVRRIERSIIERRVQPHLDIELEAADAAEIVLPRIEEHPAEEVRGGFERRRIAGAQFAVDFDQRFFRGANRVLIERARKHHADVVPLREEDVDFGDSSFGKGLPEFRGQGLVRFEQHFAGLPVHHVGHAVGAFEVGKSRAHLGDARLQKFLEQRFRDALVRADDDFFRFRIADFVRELAVHETRRNVPEEVLVAQRDAFDLVECAQNVFIGLHAQGPEKDRAEEFALAVDAHVENVLGVVFELDPGAAIRNDLAEEIGAVVGGLEENAG